MGGRRKKLAKGARPKPKRVAKVACIENSRQQLIADPWIGLRSPLGGKLSPAEEWKRLQDTTCRGRELKLSGDTANAALQATTAEALRVATTNSQVQHDLEGVSTINGDDKDVAAGEVEVKAESATTKDDDNRPVERLAIRAQCVSVANISVCVRDLLTVGLISVDVSSTQLDDAGLDSVVRWTPWLRELVAAGNNITKVPLLSNLGKLQALDLGHNGITSLPAESFPSELSSTLRKLNLEDNRLERLDVPPAEGNAPGTIGGAGGEAKPAGGQQRQHQQPQPQEQPSPVGPLPLLTSLVDLNVARNKLDKHGAEHSLAIFTKASFPRLCNLDVGGNNLPPEEETRELLRITAVLPTLKTLNGEEVSRKAMIVSSNQPMFELLSTSDQCAEEGRREESCSCTEGNPCAVSYNCRDWANRFKIAAAAATASSTAACSSGSAEKT